MSAALYSTTDTIPEEKEKLRKEFFDSLEPKDKIIHDLAVKMLKTRYTPEQTNAWSKWMKTKTSMKVS